MPGETEDRPVILPQGIVSAVTQEEALALAGLARGKTVLELGSFYGYSTVVLASVAELVISVDWHQGDEHAGQADSWGTMLWNLAHHGVAERVRAIRGRFEDEVPVLAANGVTADGAFLDGQHDEASVRRDLALALLIVRPGGFIAFHDYGRGPHNGFAGFEVTQVADGFGVTGVTGCLAWGFVPGEA